jgi:hypothetical protein
MHTIETYKELEAQLHSFLTSPLDECGWPASHHARVSSEERVKLNKRLGGAAGSVSLVKVYSYLKKYGIRRMHVNTTGIVRARE